MEVGTSSVWMLPYTASSVGIARRRLIGDLARAGVYEATACDAGLVLSELISNALRHATPLPGSLVKVSWMLGDEFSLVDCDYGPTLNVLDKAGFNFGDFPKASAYLEAIRSRRACLETPKLPGL